MATPREPELHQRADYYFAEARRQLDRPGFDRAKWPEVIAYATLLAVCDLVRKSNGEQPS